MISLAKRVESWAGRVDAERRLAVVAFVEGLLPAFVIETMLVPMVVLKPEKAWRYAFVATMGSVAGGVLALMFGWLLWMTVGQGAAMVLGIEGWYTPVSEAVRGLDVSVVLAAGITPFPFKVIGLGLGFFHGGMIQFVVAALIARGARLWCVAWLVWRHGACMQHWVWGPFFALSTLVGLGLLFVLLVIKLMAM